jgi:hypothetical protein
LREVQINFMRNGGNVDQLDELILTQTGQQSDVAMFDAEERDFMAFLADEETARTYYAAAVYESELNNLGLSPSQLEEQAYKQYLLEQGISTITATNQQQFDTFGFPGKRAAFMTEVKAETAMFLRNPTDYGSGDVQTALALKLEEIDTLKTQALEVAPNIDLSKYDQLKEEVKLAYGVIENAVTAPLDEKLKKRVVQKVTNLVDQGKITDVQGILVTQALGDPRILEIILAQEGEGSPIQDLVDAIKMLGVSEIPPEAQTEGSEGEGQVPTPQITSHVNGKAEARGEGENIALVGPYSTANKLNKLVHTEPDSVRVWGGMMADRNAALIYLGSGGNYWTDRTYERSFNTNYFKNLENLKSADPELYGVVRAQTLEAIDQSIITLTNTIEDNELFVVNPDGTVSVSDGFEEDLAKFLGNPYSPKMPNVKESMPTVMRGIREAYGVVDGKPDLLSALADPTASKIHALGAGYKPQDKAYIANFIRHARGMSSIFKDTRPEALREALGSMDFLRKLRARLTGEEPGGNFAAQAIQPENRGFGQEAPVRGVTVKPLEEELSENPVNAELPSTEEITQKFSDLNFRKEFATKVDNLLPPPEQDEAFVRKVRDVAVNLGASPDDLWKIMGFETAGSFNPAQPNNYGSSGTGLIQFMRSTAREMGTSVEELMQMDRVEQLDWVEQYLERWLSAKNVSKPTLGDLYLAVLWPAAVGKAPDEVLFDKNENPRAYKQNSIFDDMGDKDGKVTKAEVEKVITERTSAWIWPGVS